MCTTTSACLLHRTVCALLVRGIYSHTRLRTTSAQRLVLAVLVPGDTLDLFIRFAVMLYFRVPFGCTT